MRRVKGKYINLSFDLLFKLKIMKQKTEKMLKRFPELQSIVTPIEREKRVNYNFQDFLESLPLQ